MTKGDETRNQILQEALAMASTVGLEGLSIGELAKTVGLSKSGLFAHFNSKENLQLQVLKATVDRFVEMVIVPALLKPRGEPRIRALFDNVVAWSNAKFMPGGCLLMSAAHELDDQPGPLRDYLVGTQKDWLNAISNMAKIAVEEGHFRSDLDVEQFAYEFESIILASSFFKRLLRDPTTGDRSRKAIESLIERSRHPKEKA